MFDFFNGQKMKRRAYILAMASLAVLACTTANTAIAQSYPSKPIHIVVPFPAGSSTDVVARTIAIKLAQKLNQPVIIDDKPGAGGNIAAKAVADSPPDGYTLFMGTVAQAVGATFYKKLNYDFAKDFAPVTLTTTAPFVIVVNNNLPVNNLGELIAYAKRSGKPITFGSGGNGTANHLAGEMIGHKTGVKFQHVPYKGAVLALTDLMGGQIDVVIGSLIDSMPLIQSGKIKAIAVTSTKRAVSLPNVPAASETLAGFDAVGWHGVMAPLGTPKPVIDMLNREIVAVLRMPDVQSKLEAVGALPAGTSPEEFGAFVRNEVAKWGQAIRVSGAHAD